MAGRTMTGYAHNGYGARYGGRAGVGAVYDSCPGYGAGYGYGYNGCPGYDDAPLVAGVINGVLGGYGRY